VFGRSRRVAMGARWRRNGYAFSSLLRPFGSSLRLLIRRHGAGGRGLVEPPLGGKANREEYKQAIAPERRLPTSAGRRCFGRERHMAYRRQPGSHYSQPWLRWG